MSRELNLPSLGYHLRMWGNGGDLHICETTDAPHAGPCVCTCGAVAPGDQ